MKTFQKTTIKSNHKNFDQIITIQSINYKKISKCDESSELFYYFKCFIILLFMHKLFIYAKKLLRNHLSILISPKSGLKKVILVS